MSGLESKRRPAGERNVLSNMNFGIVNFYPTAVLGFWTKITFGSLLRNHFDHWKSFFALGGVFSHNALILNSTLMCSFWMSLISQMSRIFLRLSSTSPSALVLTVTSTFYCWWRTQSSLKTWYTDPEIWGGWRTQDQRHKGRERWSSLRIASGLTQLAGNICCSGRLRWWWSSMVPNTWVGVPDYAVLNCRSDPYHIIGPPSVLFHLCTAVWLWLWIVGSLWEE